MTVLLRQPQSEQSGDALHTSVGNGFVYAYLRPHKRRDGTPCPVEHTGPLATPIGGRR